MTPIGERILEEIDTPIIEDVLFFDTMRILVSLEVRQKAHENRLPQNNR